MRILLLSSSSQPHLKCKGGLITLLHFMLDTQLSDLKVGVPISARVLKSTPRVGGTYLSVFTWVYKSTYQVVFIVHNAASIILVASGRF